MVEKRKESRSAAKLRKAVKAALGRDRELMSEVTEVVRRRASNRLTSFPTLLQAADALEPVLAEAVRRRPSFLGQVAHDTAQLLSTLTAQDRSSNLRLAELAESSHVGIVFVDLAGFTEYTVQNGDKAAVDIVERLEALVGEQRELYQGEVVKHLGDGFLLAFPSAAQALRCALALRERAGQIESLPMVRIAVHAGTPSIERDDVIGHDVNLTARLLEHCGPGEVLVTKEAKELAEPDLESARFRSTGNLKARGVPESIEAYRAE